ncbi:MAG: regulatory protein GemA [Ahrensia sp.]|nr:regulatory protein GemA [Ahrensia sp.]
MNQIAKIHIAKKQLGFDDETYRAMLQLVTGKSSCKEMKPAELNKVLKHLQANGFVAHGKGAQSKTHLPASKKAYVRLIYVLWSKCHQSGQISDGSKKALRAFVAARTQLAGHRRDDPEFLSYDEASPIIEALKAMEKRGRG